MRTLGLDVSPLRIGWAITGEADDLPKHGTIHFKSGDWVDPGMRFDAMENILECEEVDRIGLEAVFVGPNKLGSIRAAMALGQIEMVCSCMFPNARQKVLTAAQWRSLAGVVGSGKDGVMDWAHDYTEGDTPADQDAADALAISVAAARWFDENE